MVGGMGAFLVLGLVGCEQKGDNQAQEQKAQQGAFVVIEEVAPGRYKIVEEYPSSTTRVVLRDINGSERLLSQEEIDQLLKAEAAKIDANASPLVNPQLENQMSLGEVLLASAAGAILGAWLGNKLFGNPTYQQRRQETYKSPTVFQRSQSAFKSGGIQWKSGTKSSSPVKSGFFKGSSTPPTQTKSFSFGG
ncbi:MAG: hypothetical protein C6I00_03215 [Nitratiruptor sp.]|nr:hypothetical protein [Nitratiruptor sp.]NPA83469.1 hypothetical protein [Campylobacterota bacterium]